MASRVLLINANRCATPEPVFPLGLGYLDAALRQAGHQTAWWDGLVPGPALKDVLASFAPDVVGISVRNIDDVMLRQRRTFHAEAVRLCAVVRRHSPATVVLGGSGFSIFPERLMEATGADFGIHGAGARSLVGLVDALGSGQDPAGLPGLVRRHATVWRVNPPDRGGDAAAVEPLSWPEAVAQYYLRAAGMLSVQTQRGCACQCAYCTYPLIEGRVAHSRPAAHVAAELVDLEKLGVRYAFLVDSVFNSSAAHVRAICEAILQRDLHLHWACFLRPQGLTAELMRLMVRAGLRHIEFGSDSFCDRVLEAYRKHFTWEDILESSRLARDAQVDYCHFLACGGPGETLDTLEESLRNSQMLPGPVVMALAGLRIYPGTELHRRALQEGRVAPDANLLDPCYYLAPGLDGEVLLDVLREFSRRCPAWIAGDPSPGYNNLVVRLRQRGVLGPLWSYMAMLQRITPSATRGDTAIASASDPPASPRP
jgi:radical SAM superfamily enzyme YgiQ (UPF0313 family)